MFAIKLIIKFINLQRQIYNLNLAEFSRFVILAVWRVCSALSSQYSK